jgi:hypothetical protein
LTSFGRLIYAKFPILLRKTDCNIEYWDVLTFICMYQFVRSKRTEENKLNEIFFTNKWLLHRYMYVNVVWKRVNISLRFRDSTKSAVFVSRVQTEQLLPHGKYASTRCGIYFPICIKSVNNNNNILFIITIELCHF